MMIRTSVLESKLLPDQPSILPAQRSADGAERRLPVSVMNRRHFLSLLGTVAAGLGISHSQESGGMASRGVRPQPRGKPSGLPFHARFTDVAAHAGLRDPVFYGPHDRMDFILESMGCGVANKKNDNENRHENNQQTGTRRG